MASKYIQKFPIPTDFPNILHDLAKEVLRYQPEDITEFCALYFKCLQEGKELDYPKKGQNIPCDFKNVIPGIKSENERNQPQDKSNLKEALEKANKLSQVKDKNDNEDPYKSKIIQKEKEQTNLLNIKDAAKTEESQNKETQENIIQNDESGDDLVAPDDNDNELEEKEINIHENNHEGEEAEGKTKFSLNSEQKEQVKKISMNFLNEVLDESKPANNE